jgi:DNA-binding response OmpR family regulator
MAAPSGRLMVIDDEPHVRELLRDFLTGEGHDVTTFALGADALAAVPTIRPNVIIVDMLMPGLSGAEVLDELRRAGLRTPVILVSGTTLGTHKGFFRQLVKPFNLRTVAEAVMAALTDPGADA